VSGIIWIIIVGFVAGIIARFLSPGANKPAGFILTTVLGIAGAFLWCTASFPTTQGGHSVRARLVGRGLRPRGGHPTYTRRLGWRAKRAT
jgi:uncharacterized membrane protein YeaQ/YmgE (transglycosylase-associated protein family)